MNNVICFLLSVSIWLCASSVNAWQQAPAQGSDPSENINPPEADQGLNSEQINRLIEQLDSNKFLIRENATEKLLSADASIIIPIATAANSGSLEKCMRCLHILKEFAVGIDVDAEIESMRQLSDIATNDNSRISTYARDLLKNIEPLQAERAVRILRSLGIEFTSFQPQPGIPGLSTGPGILINDQYRGTVDQLHYLQHLDFIQDVQITGNKVSATMLTHITKMPNVHLMSIKDAPVDLEMLKALTPLLPKLSKVRFYYLPLDDKAVPLLKKLTSVSKAEFYGLNLSLDARTELLAALPEAVAEAPNIPFRDGGFLGVTSDRESTVCIFSDVRRDGGAYEAGALSGDKVIQVDDTEVSNFSDLTKHLKNKRAGDSVNLTVVRNGEEIKMEVTLKKWPMLPVY